ncbi:MAG: response regulator transcription factor [Anaerolineae bacterium]|jgi:two-component system KDP operon response regulator KdpE
MAEKILLVDDDEALLTLTSAALQREGFDTFTAVNGEQALELFHQVTPDLIILDIMMPGVDGREVCRRLRRISTVPIIFLTALDSGEDIVDGLMKGADDYLPKPFKNTELVARVTALLRRARMPHSQPEILRFGDGDLVINRSEQRVFTGSGEVSLSPTEYNLLLFLAERAGRILSSQQIFDTIWGPWSETQPGSVKWYIWHLRQKIEPDPGKPRFILTERGRGYRFSPR